MQPNSTHRCRMPLLLLPSTSSSGLTSSSFSSSSSTSSSPSSSMRTPPSSRRPMDRRVCWRSLPVSSGTQSDASSPSAPASSRTSTSSGSSRMRRPSWGRGRGSSRRSTASWRTRRRSCCAEESGSTSTTCSGLCSLARSEGTTRSAPRRQRTMPRGQQKLRQRLLQTIWCWTSWTGTEATCWSTGRGGTMSSRSLLVSRI
mmetsp:Transcript_13890/g.48009  ORF Transcript_13890/g.48009 Transcript_13890/m.48009 type:complete len:201 (-) Transcript_13890:1649-2251(-)